jgi:hypothetical protein
VILQGRFAFPYVAANRTCEHLIVIFVHVSIQIRFPETNVFAMFALDAMHFGHMLVQVKIAPTREVALLAFVGAAILFAMSFLFVPLQ